MASGKEILLNWAKQRTGGYRGVNITDFSGKFFFEGSYKIVLRKISFIRVVLSELQINFVVRLLERWIGISCITSQLSSESSRFRGSKAKFLFFHISINSLSDLLITERGTLRVYSVLYNN